jgi:glycosyltransferase involved in cell wall biosynthesis
MPSYNHESYVSEAIESVLNQSFTDFELVIVDDGSKDNSKKVIKSYQEKDERIRTIFHMQNLGIARTLNDGIDNAQGRFVALIASDDVWAKSKLEKQLAELEKDENAIVWSEGETIDSEGRSTGETFTEKRALQRKKSGYIFEDLLHRNFIFGSSIIFKKEHTKNIHFDEDLRYLNDYRFVVDLARKYKFNFIQEPLAKYRVHGRNITLTNRVSWLRDEVRIGKYFLQKYGNEIPNRTKAYLLFKVGRAYSRLGETSTARQLFLKAVCLSFFCKDSLPYLSFALTSESVFSGPFSRRFIQRCGFLTNEMKRKIQNTCF